MTRPVLYLCFAAGLAMLTGCTGDFDIPPQRAIDSDVSATHNAGGSTLNHDGPHPVELPHD
jgi:hypothetical protein